MALSQRGWTVAQIEKADGFAEVGAGIQLSPNANHVLRELGVFDKLTEVTCPVTSLRIFSARTGDMINEVPLGQTIEERHGAPYLVAHRADLHSTLLDACLADPNITIRMGSSIANASSDKDGVTVEFSTADGLASQRGLALIGADGVHSIVRRRLLRLPAAVFSGKVAYRATIGADQIPAKYHGNSYLWLGPDAHVVHYPIRQFREFNFIAIVDEDWNQEGWSAPGDKQTILDKFGNWPGEIKDLISIPNRWLKWAVCTTDASGIWSDERIAVLGDAAHSMLPFLAQGGAMALEDAWVLAKFLQDGDDIPTKLLAFEDERRDRIHRVAAAAIENGRIYHLSGIPARARDVSMRILTAEWFLKRYDWLFGWKP